MVAVCRSIHREGWDPQVVRRTRELERAAQAVRSAVEARASGGLGRRYGARDTLERFAAEHGLPFLAIADLIKARDAEHAEVRRVATAALPTMFGDLQTAAYRSCNGAEHLAIVLGDVAAHGVSEDGVLVGVEG